ncbi:MAG: ABC transporter substrate-binding protein [Gemmobacter sp.]|uniref:ABC transporter substrate-binding protein n=1 Tax=Gemmobacter sp. TaxID=1898957 RepID=UPI001A5392A1|nr:ABC transporter substrate-binding protein [Gemmobacter sp.]MBL8563245.1 ABC transporter substrate-binding protein [Gemmobacter sp.]
MLFRLILPLLLCLAPAALAEPVTLRHGFGETTLDPAQVTRIVSVGYHEQDFLYALGLAPVGVHDWFGDHPYATGPWAEAARQAVAATPEVQKGFEIDVEWVWSMEPDLIVASFAPMDAQTYALLSEIAPVVGPPEGYPAWGAPWEAELRLIAQATGRAAQAEAVITGVSAKIDAAVAAHPGLRGLSGTAAYFNDGQAIGYRSHDGVNRLLAQIGIATPPVFDTMVNEGGLFSVSPERLDLFDLDVLLWLVEAPKRPGIEALPSWRTLRVAREGRAIWASPEMMGAMSFQSPLSISWALDRLLPLLVAAADGDPATGANSLPKQP